MDSKHQISQLDPKIKEAYERVMNAPTNHPDTSNSINGTTLPVNTNNSPSNTISPPIVASQPTITATRREPEKIHIGSAPHGYTAAKKKMSISPIFYIVGGVIFLIVYIIFWLKFFNIPLPFLH